MAGGGLRWHWCGVVGVCALISILAAHLCHGKIHHITQQARQDNKKRAQSKAITKLHHLWNGMMIKSF